MLSVLDVHVVIIATVSGLPSYSRMGPDLLLIGCYF